MKEKGRGVEWREQRNKKNSCSRSSSMGFLNFQSFIHILGKGEEKEQNRVRQGQNEVSGPGFILIVTRCAASKQAGQIIF
jgi:hypothetical protein